MQHLSEKNALVSIIIPVFNRAVMTLETLKSIQNQSYSHFECILVDDGSTDNSIAVISDFIKQDERFKLFSRPECLLKGANSCRNYGFEISKGEFVNWFDSDDIMHPNFIAAKMAVFDDCDVVISKHCYFSDTIQNILSYENRTHSSDNLFEDFVILKISWYTPDPLWRKAFLTGKQLFREELKKGQDRDLHIRLLMDKPKTVFLDKYLTYYRLHENTISNTFSAEVAQTHFDALNKNIELILKYKNSKALKFYLLKLQIKNYRYLYKEKNIFFPYVKVFVRLFGFNYNYFKWVLKFLITAFIYETTAKKYFLLKY
jgi:glycosyltransferase involved in cell wall biosynthesis